jgi:hypothetical protein
MMTLVTNVCSTPFPSSAERRMMGQAQRAQLTWSAELDAS